MKKPRKKPRKLKRVLQCQVDPCRLLPLPLRRRATEILNALRQTDPAPLQLPIGEAHVVGIAMHAAYQQGLQVVRSVAYLPPPKPESVRNRGGNQ